LGETFQEWLGSYGPSLIGAVLVLVIGWWASRIIRSLVRRLMGRAGIDETLTGFTGNLTYMALMALVVITALGQLGVATTSFAAILGASALAIGFALQGSLGNFAAGVMLMLFRPFKTGDFVSRPRSAPATTKRSRCPTGRSPAAAS
jgi:small conductance mechanosensitive channel